MRLRAAAPVVPLENAVGMWATEQSRVSRHPYSGRMNHPTTWRSSGEADQAEGRRASRESSPFPARPAAASDSPPGTRRGNPTARLRTAATAQDATLAAGHHAKVATARWQLRPFGPPAQAPSSNLVQAGDELAIVRAQLEECLQQRRAAETGILELQQQLKQARLRVAEADYRADHDPLTGLPNRRLLLDRANQALKHAERNGRRLGLVLLDLDGFKQVNDVFGHATGDALLIRVARALRSVIRAEDTACRFGGDEFVILLPDIARADSIGIIAAKVEARLQRVRSAGGAKLTVAASLGLAVFPNHGRSAAELLRHADLAMYDRRAHARATDRTSIDRHGERSVRRTRLITAGTPTSFGTVPSEHDHRRYAERGSEARQTAAPGRLSP